MVVALLMTLKLVLVLIAMALAIKLKFRFSSRIYILYFSAFLTSIFVDITISGPMILELIR